VLGLPDEAEPIAFTPLGHPAQEAGAKKRCPLESLVRHERW
jgi:nitroreductase